MLKHKLMLPILAVIVGAAASAFTIKPKVHTSPDTHKADMFYFQFVGTPNSQEGDINQWENISQATYELPTCDGANYGCKIQVNDTVHISNGSSYDVRPKGVDLVTGTNNPTLGTNVQEFKNLED